MPAASAQQVTIRVAESMSELAALEPEWERLQGDAAVASVFASFDWLHLWWKAYHGGRPLRLMLASAGGELVGILPLYVDSVPMLRFPVRLLRLVGTGGDTSPDDLGPVLARGRETEVAAALADAVLALPGWDVLLLTDLDPASAFVAAMRGAATRTLSGCLSGRSERIAYLELPDSFEAWLKSLDRDRRYRVRNVRKKLNAAHAARFFVWQDPATLDQGIDRLIHLHLKRWQTLGTSHSFSSHEYLTFHRALMHACLARDRLRLYCLELDGQVAAIYYFYRFRNRVFLMQSGFDPDHANVKPGQVLLGYIIESAISEGDKVLDFLRGDHRYKDELATGERETVYLTAFRVSPGALVYHVRKRLLPVVKARVLAALERLRPTKPESQRP